MKILYLVHAFYPDHHGGTEKFVLQLAQHMQLMGHQVKVITYDQPRPRAQTTTAKSQWKTRLLKRAAVHRFYQTVLNALWDQWYKHVPDPIQSYEDKVENVPVLRFRSPMLTKNNFHLANASLASFARQVLEDEAPDIIHSGYTLHTVEFLSAAQQLRIPYLLTLTSYWLLCPRHILLTEKGELCQGPRGGAECKFACPSFAPKQIHARYAAMQALLAAAAAIIVPSHHLAKLFQRELGAIKLDYIPYGIATQHLPLNVRSYPNSQPLTFFYGGRLVAEKGISLLLAAFRRLSCPHVKLHIYGTGKLIEEVQQAAQADARIHYGGVYTTDQTGHLLQTVDVVVVPSIWHENLPLIMQEAQACGVPTLVADVGGMTECVTDGVNGFTFRVGDEMDLQRKLQVIIDQPERLNTLKANMRHPQHGHYRVTSLAEETALYLKQYEQILAQPQHKRLVGS